MSVLKRARAGAKSFLSNDTDDFSSSPIPRHSSAQTAVLLVVLAVALLGTVLFFDFLYPLSPARLERPATALMQNLAFWRRIRQSPPDALNDPESLAVLIVLGAVIGFAAYALAIWLAWRKPPTRPLLAISVGSSALFMLVTLWSLPNFNTDVYDHILYARTATEYGENPYIVTPVDFRSDSIYPYASPRYVNVPTNKLPAWTLLSMGAAALAGDDPVTNLLVARGSITLFSIGSVILIALILLRWNPHYAVAGVIIYGWNPLTIVMAQGKTEPMMVFFVMLGVLMLIMKHYRWMVVFLAVATLVKLIPMLFVGVYLLREIKARRWREVVISGGLFALVIVALSLPFINTADTVQDQLALLQRSGSELPGSVRLVFAAGFVGLLLYMGLYRARSDRQMLWSWAFAMLYFGLFLTEITLAWYHLPFIAIASVAIRWPMVLTMLAITWTSFLLNAWRAASTPAFTLPSPDVPRLALYLALPMVALLGSLALYALRTRRAAHPNNA